jgi:hypothetical protein
MNPNPAWTRLSIENCPRRKIRLIVGNAKCCHLNKLTCEGTSQQVFLKVFRLLELHSGMYVFSTQLSDLLPLSPSLWFNSLLLPCVNKYMYVYSV